MYHFSESDLNIKSVAQLKDVYVQLGCTEVITDKRIKANWVQAILTHQSALVEKVTVAEIAQLLLQPKIEEQSTQNQDLLEQINHIRYAWENSCDQCINYKNGAIWLTSTPEFDVYTMWETQDEADLANEILSKISTPAVIEEQPKTCTTCPLFKPFNDGTGRGLCCGSDSVARDHFPQTGDCLHLIEESKQHDGNVDIQAANDLTENLREARRIEYSTRQTSPEGRVVQSGSLTFNPVEYRTYEVWNGIEKYGAIKMSEDGLWLQNYSATTKYGTPYEAAAALVEATQLRQTRSADIQVLENWGDKFVVRNIQNGCHYVVQPNHSEPKERCECGDCHYRGVVCKHQVAVADHAQIESLSDDIEVDSISDPDFGLLYRVWKSWELLGTFYHALDSKWVAQPCESDARPRCETANQAQLLILAMAGMLVAGEVEEDLEVPVI